MKEIPKRLAILLILCLGFPPPGLALPAGGIPSELGLVVESFSPLSGPQPNQPFLIHILDAHDSYFVQRKIADLIDFFVTRYGIEQVYQEGNTGLQKTSEIFWFRHEPLRKALALELLKEGKLTGPEFAHLLDPKGFRLTGVEDPLLYRKNLRLQEEILRFRERWDSLEPAAREKIEANPALKRISLLRATPDDLKQLRGEVNSPTLDKFVVSSEPLTLPSPPLGERAKGEEETGPGFHKRRISPLFSKLFAFYELAEKRDQALIENTLSEMARSGTDRALLVTGGFHWPGISQTLRERGVPFVVIAPADGRLVAQTLRKPNLFNLSPRHARMFVDLRGMFLTRSKSPSLYRRLEKDLQRLWIDMPEGGDFENEVGRRFLPAQSFNENSRAEKEILRELDILRKGYLNYGYS